MDTYKYIVVYCTYIRSDTACLCDFVLICCDATYYETRSKLGSIPSDDLYQNRHFIRTAKRMGKGSLVWIKFSRKIGLIARVYRLAQHILHSVRLVSGN